MAAGNTAFNTFVSSTIRHYLPKLVNNLMGHNVLLWMLKERGFTETRSGGRSISHPLMYAQGQGTAAYSGYDELPLTPSEGITRSEFDWKFYSQPVSIAGTEEFMNQGKEAILNLLEAKIEQAETTLKLAMNTDLVSGDGTSRGGKSVTGLKLAVEDGSSWSTYGGIDGSDAENSWWRNQYFDFDTFMGGATKFQDAYGQSCAGIHAMNRMYNNCSLGKSTPQLILTTQTLFEEYEEYVQGKMGRVDMTVNSNARRVADAGFQALQYKGAAIVFDEDVPSEEMIFLNPEFIKFVTGAGRDFKNTDFMRPPNQDARHSFIFWAGNLTMRKRDQHGRITALTEGSTS